MKNNIRKTSIHQTLLIFFMGAFSINAKSEGSLNVSYRQNDTEERRNINNQNSLMGFPTGCNILLCELRKYVNCFFPIPTGPRGSECFWDVYQRKMDQPPSSSILMATGSFGEQKRLLVSYIKMAKSYLETMRHFYPTGGSWANAQDNANDVFDNVIAEINSVTDTDGSNGLASPISELRNASSVWPCFHTEPICVFDHIQGTDYSSHPPGARNFTFETNPIIIHSRFKPCSRNQNLATRFDCEEMLNAVARVSGHDIEFRYYQ